MCDAVTISQPLADSHSNTFIEQALFSAPFFALFSLLLFPTTPSIPRLQFSMHPEDRYVYLNGARL